MAAVTKNTYERKHDEVILDALEQSPDNRNEAYRIAQRKLKEKFDMEATTNQISSRYYTYIKPNYIDKGTEKNQEIKNHIVTSAGSGILNPNYSKQYNVIKELALKLSSDERMQLAKELLITTMEE